ncbi:MAG: RNA polymerase sigma factor [Eubacterium sp.]|jgi:RNA polymerase sigma-70 factor (ECF subfamily)|nr:RNA polymerase sigma factor [Eubacterium sp.]
MDENKITKERFIAVVEEAKDVMYRLSFGILRNKADAEDAVAESLLKAWEKLDSLNKGESLRGWLIRIVINTSKNILSVRNRTIPCDQDELAAAVSVQDQPPGTGLWSHVWEMTEVYRSVLLLYYYSGYSVKEIAEALRVPEGTVKSRLSRAREELRQILEYDRNAGT